MIKPIFRAKLKRNPEQSIIGNSIKFADDMNFVGAPTGTAIRNVRYIQENETSILGEYYWEQIIPETLEILNMNPIPGV
jgi:hypothetical protein